MKNIKKFEERKNALIQKIERLKGEKISETKFNFLGRCGKMNAIDTNLNKDINGILSGQLIKFHYPNSKNIQLFACVGIGNGCECGGDKDTKVLWFIGEVDDTVFYFSEDTDTFEKLVKNVVVHHSSIVLVP